MSDPSLAVGTLLAITALACFLWPWLDAAAGPEPEGRITPGETQAERLARLR